MNKTNRKSCLQLLPAGVIFILILILLGVTSETVAAPLAAEASSQTSVTLSWSAPGDDGSLGTATAYSLRYSTSIITEINWAQATEVSNVPAPQIAASSESYEITDLTPGTQYYFGIKAVDEADNWSGLSNVVTTITDPESVAPAAVADLRLLDSSAVSLTIGWTAPGDDTSTGTASVYDLRYSNSPIDVANFASATPVINVGAPQIAGSSESVVVGGLTPNSTYYFALMTADEVPNWSTLSNVPSGSTTEETFAPTAVSDLVALNATETTIDLAWSATGDDSTSGQATLYDIRYSISSITEANWDSSTQIANVSSPLAAGNAEVHTVTDLSSNTQYYFAMKVVDDVGNWSGLSNVANLSTGADQTPPATIGNLSVTSGQ